MTGIPLIIAFFIMVVVMIVAISKFKIHPFLSIMGVSLILALLALPLAKVPGTIGAVAVITVVPTLCSVITPVLTSIVATDGLLLV